MLAMVSSLSSVIKFVSLYQINELRYHRQIGNSGNSIAIATAARWIFGLVKNFV